VERLRAFLQKYVDVLDPGTTVGLLAGYGRLDELMHFARCRGDWEGLLEYLLQRQEVRGVDLIVCALDTTAASAGGGSLHHTPPHKPPLLGLAACFR
jgi:hypothetical protein